MDLSISINQICPNIGHDHRISIHKSPRKKCFICSPLIELKFKLSCPNYRLYKSVKLPYDIKSVLHFVFSRKNSSYYLPQELEDYIIIILETPILIKEYTMTPAFLKHTSKCRSCAAYLLKILEENACSRHILPRTALNNNDKYNLLKL